MQSTSGPLSTTADSATAHHVVVDLYQAQWGRLLAALVVRTRRLDIAEDALAESFTRASTRWPVDGVPPNPTGWLFVTAHRLILGRLRSEAVAGRAAPLLIVRAGDQGDCGEPNNLTTELPDDRLQLILLCCHPALDPASQCALALRLVVGTSTADIARLFLVQQSAMAARLTRAKRKIVAAGIPLIRPVEQELSSRIDAVTRSIYLAFTAGYAPGSGSELLRIEEASEAVKLAMMVHQLLPDARQVTALLALLLLQHARRDSRVHTGELVTLPLQDRSLWHRNEIAVAQVLLNQLPPSTGYAEELRLQALAAREHAIADSSDSTNWRAIAGHYADLEALTGSPIVRLNRAIAVAEYDGPQAGLHLLLEVADRLNTHHRFHAVKADFLRRAGKRSESDAAYAQAIALCNNTMEQAYLRKKLATSACE
jgi:RNA polymerase sigma-70 factor, ECF subfamily